MYLYGKWADSEGFVYVEEDEIKSIFDEQKVPEQYDAVQNTLYLKANAFYEIVLTKWAELVAERKQQEIYQFLSGEQQSKLQKYFNLLQWTWKSTLLELYSRMTDRREQFNYTPDNFFIDSSVDAVIQTLIEELDEGDKDTRDNALNDPKYQRIKPPSTLSIHEIVTSYYGYLHKVFSKFQQMQNERQAENKNRFELENREPLFLRKTKTRDLATEALRRRLFDRAQFVFMNIYQKFTEAAKRWNEFKDKKGQKLTQAQQATSSLTGLQSKTRLSEKEKRDLQSQTSLKLDFGNEETKEVKEAKPPRALAPISVAEMRRNFRKYGKERHKMTPEQVHNLLRNLPHKVQMNPEQKEGIHRGVVQGQPIVNVQAPPGTGKTATLAHLIALVGQTDPESRIIIVNPTNLAGDKLGQKMYRGCTIKWSDRDDSPCLRQSQASIWHRP